MKIPFLCFVILTTLCTKAQTFFEFTRQTNRTKHDQNLKEGIIIGSLQQPLTVTTERAWVKAFWAMELLLYKTAHAKQKIAEAWKKSNELSESFQKALLEVTYTLYPFSFSNEVKALLTKTGSPVVFIRCAEYLLLNEPDDKGKIEKLLEQKFGTNDYTGFAVLKQRLKNKAIQQIPPLKDIFGKQFLPGQTVIYSLQRSNRNYAGLVLIRKPDGSFVKMEDGNFFHTEQLARAITNYPFYITNGNTPQGIFRWTGFDTSSISYIGPTPNLQMLIPYESSPHIFMNNKAFTAYEWSRQLYESLLPQSWKNYDGIYQSFLAGAMGRSEIIMHGTTINPDYYKGQSYFPQTPSLGCLCSYEQWNKTGELIVSNQQKIIDALNSIDSKNGYVVVIDLPDKNEKVTIKEMAAFIH